MQTTKREDESEEEDNEESETKAEYEFKLEATSKDDSDDSPQKRLDFKNQWGFSYVASVVNNSEDEEMDQEDPFAT
jgi:hypothetical protein